MQQNLVGALPDMSRDLRTTCNKTCCKLWRNHPIRHATKLVRDLPGICRDLQTPDGVQQNLVRTLLDIRRDLLTTCNKTFCKLWEDPPIRRATKPTARCGKIHLYDVQQNLLHYGKIHCYRKIHLYDVQQNLLQAVERSTAIERSTSTTCKKTCERSTRYTQINLDDVQQNIVRFA